MTKNAIDVLGAITLIAAGFLFAFFHKSIGEKTADFQYRILRVRFSNKGYQVSFLIYGVIFIILGLLHLVGILRFK